MSRAGVASEATKAAPPTLAELRARHRDGKTALLERFAATRPTARGALTLIRALAGQVDETLLALWQRCGMPAGPSLAAVGGYGRGELFPHSDVDVLVILPGDGWTIVTRDRSLSAQWEHTVLVTDSGYEVMTLSAGSPPPPAFVSAA